MSRNEKVRAGASVPDAELPTMEDVRGILKGYERAPCCKDVERLDWLLAEGWGELPSGDPTSGGPMLFSREDIDAAMGSCAAGTPKDHSPVLETSQTSGASPEQRGDAELPPHTPDYGEPGHPTRWCERCRIDAARAENLARRFHETYERLAPSFGYETRKDSAKPWSEVPDKNRRLMVAVCAELLTLRSASDAKEPLPVSPVTASLEGNEKVTVLEGRVAALREALMEVVEMACVCAPGETCPAHGVAVRLHAERSEATKTHSPIPGTASDAEPSEDEVERGIEQWFLGDDLSVMDDEMWDENRRAMRRVLSDFLTRRRSGGNGGNGNLTGGGASAASTGLHPSAEAMLTEMIAQARRGHPRFCLGIHHHEDGQTEEEWEDWGVTFRRLALAVNEPQKRSTSECGCPDHVTEKECVARCRCACNADFVRVDRWECRVGCGLPLKESEIEGHDCMKAMRDLANQLAHLADRENASAGRDVRLLPFVERIARMNWDGEERPDGTTADISNDDNHDTMIGLIEEAREIVMSAGHQDSEEPSERDWIADLGEPRTDMQRMLIAAARSAERVHCLACGVQRSTQNAQAWDCPAGTAYSAHFWSDRVERGDTAKSHSPATAETRDADHG